MNIWGDHAWTSPDETEELAAKFRQKHGQDVAAPACMICKRQTCYVVEPVEGYQERHLGYTVNLFDMRILQDGANFYLPVKLCVQCSAVDDAKYAAKSGGRAPHRDAMRGMTADERRIYESTWWNVFNAAGGNAQAVDAGKRYAP